jgi:hypothetical protein
LVLGTVNYFSEDGINRFLQKATCKLYGVVSDPLTLKPEATLSSETSLSNPIARRHVPEDDNYYDVHQQKMFSIGQSLLPHKYIYGEWKLQAQFKATYKKVNVMHGKREREVD